MASLELIRKLLSILDSKMVDGDLDNDMALMITYHDQYQFWRTLCFYSMICSGLLMKVSLFCVASTEKRLEIDGKSIINGELALATKPSDDRQLLNSNSLKMD